MSAPRIKRPFAGASADPSQRQITSFFSPGALPAHVDDADVRPLRQPLIPSSVQADLLNVGMRVRKSVPEGYKTVGPSGFKLWTDNTRAGAVRNPNSATRGARSMSRELLPFCGINKIGGLDAQPSFREDDTEEDGDKEVPDLDAVPELTMSQESVESNASEPSRKRFFHEDEEDSSASVPSTWAAREAAKAWDCEVSPRTLYAPMGWGNARPLATPRTRVRKSIPAAAAADVSLKDVDQENMALDGGDFQEAEFLVFGQGREMDMS
ncbi:hypothetical protein JDV02_000384 [Purpureocillium takamizusanense]|uniref:Uncharacterized protein n=1 Tax=Purpureocillium takamizusanense TaxID=2060973 RepID=A0A9Q8Q6H9_9HYPO|nr:uncharacterized protein JDV02_000384 [Purpureocillium takamizusanense]UNI13662.1 hypothetical protein JDV02_000384 [Purpureocillium takamizusanense]